MALRLLLILVGLLLMFMCVRNVAVTFAGQKTSATVTHVEQVVDASNDVTDHTYAISYAFTAKNGKKYTGSYQKARVHNTSTLPATGSSVRVKYLPVAPWMNMQGDSNILGGIVMGGLGLLVMAFGVRPGKKTAKA